MTQSPHIIIVDDEAPAREMVGDYLKMHGFGVTLCDGGKSLRAVIETSVPDLVVLDLNMPEEDGLSIRVGPFELAQQAVAALDGDVESCLRGLFAPENLFEFFVDHGADQHKGAEPDSLRIPGRRHQGQLLDTDGSARIAIVEALRAGEVESGAGDRQIAGVLVPGGLNFRLREIGEEPCDAGIFGARPVAQHP